MSAAPSLRAAAEADLPAITALVRTIYAKWVPVIGLEPMPMRAAYREALRIDRIDLLHVKGALVGLIETLL